MALFRHRLWFRGLFGAWMVFSHSLKSVSRSSGAASTLNSTRRDVSGQACASDRLLLQVEKEGEELRITEGQGQGKGVGGGDEKAIASPERVAHACWLRQNCQCSACVQAFSGQRFVEAHHLEGVKIDSVRLQGDNLKLCWVQATSGCKHEGEVAISKVWKHLSPPPSLNSITATTLPVIDYQVVLESDSGLWEWLKNLGETGMCLVEGVPTEDKIVKTLCDRICHAQKTIYGEVFEVVLADKPINIAYSAAELPLHMDLVYYESPPGLQLLHCLRFDSCVEGGESVLVDTLPVLEELRKEHPTHFHSLATLPATFQKIHYQRDLPVEMFYRRPHISLDQNGHIVGVFWAPAFEGPLQLPKESMKPYYEAYCLLGRMLNNSSHQLTHRLQPGEALTFSNRRVLHSRKEFKPNGGQRYFQGAYVNIDEFESRLKSLSTQLGLHWASSHVFNQTSC